MPHCIRRALISVYDKTGIVEFAHALADEFGIEIISTGGTARALQDAGIPVTLVEQVTGFPELLDGRVKTLHPKIHAAILADRDNPEHMRQLAEQGIQPIDMVVVNLYPFEKTIAKPECTFEEALEMIDIGGPCLLRAAAKNHRHVLVVIGSRVYPRILDTLRQAAATESLRTHLARSACHITSRYDQHVTAYLSDVLRRAFSVDEPEGQFEVPALGPTRGLRYGENPHQAGAFRPLLPEGPYECARPLSLPEDGDPASAEISFNNCADASAALDLCAELTRACEEGSPKLRFDEGSPKLRFDEGSPKLRFDEGSPKLRFAPGTPKLCFGDSQETAKARFAPIRGDLLQRRKLPHWQRPGATYWITFSSAIGPLDPAERDITLAALRHWDGDRLDLLAAVVMPDHVHALLASREIPDRPGAYYNLSELLKSIKSFSGREISQTRGGGGQVWTRESFDRWIRSEADLEEKYTYLAENAVKEGLAATPEAYPWWYAVDVLGIGIGVPAAPHGEGKAELRGPTDKAKLRGPTDKAELRGPTDKAELRGPTDKAELCGPRNKAELRGPRDKAELCAPIVCFIKHTNACGVAVHPDPVEAYRSAYLGDPNAALGGILAVNFPVDVPFAEAVLETYARWGKPLKDAGAPYAPGGFFVEVWVAPYFEEPAVNVIRTKKDWGKRVRLLAVGDMSVQPDAQELDFKRIAGGMLVQTRDLLGLNEAQWQVVTQRPPTDAELDDLRLAWLICKHTKSNAITICKGGTLIGNGAGQMSRVMSCRIATWLAKENGHADQLAGAVAASDAFFPFRDGPDLLIEAGVTALIQPGGSKRDAEVIAACNERRVAMVCTGTRHFRH